jgi:ATP-dependent RNA helicase DDX23/PRP28
VRDLQREQIKKEYMGLKEKKKRFVKPSEKFKFNFEWDEGEDTSADLNPLYSKRSASFRNNTTKNFRLEVRPALGRGYIGGVDKREQLQRYKDMVKKEGKRDDSTMVVEGGDNVRCPSLPLRLTFQAVFERQLTALERQEYGGRHWSEKKEKEMTSRDWRIFKEDFRITTKGGGIPHPIRKWDESGLPDWLMLAIKDAGYEKPTAVQMQAIPIGAYPGSFFFPFPFLLGRASGEFYKLFNFIFSAAEFWSPLLWFAAKLINLIPVVGLQGSFNFFQKD